MANWFHRFFNPHCEHCMEERREVKLDTKCESCDTLRRQLEIANHQNEQLLTRLIEKPAPAIETREPVAISRPKNIPWNLRKQMLEAEDRHAAKLMREAPKPDTVKVDVEDLEKEILAVQNEG